MPKFIFLFALFLPVCLQAQSCQTLDLARSKIVVELDTPFGKYQGRVIKASGWLLKDNKQKKTVISIPAGGIVLDEEGIPPIFLGFINSALARSIIFRSKSIVSSDVGGSYNVEGTGLVAGREFPASFPVKVLEDLDQSSLVTAEIKSKNLKEIVGIDGTAQAFFNLRFQKSMIENCVG